MNTQQRQALISTLAKSSLGDIQKYWNDSLENHTYQTVRPAQTGMVMAVGRTEATGEPFNLGEVTVTRCALRLKTGETGIGYVMGSSEKHASLVAILDALAQKPENYANIEQQVIRPLQQKIKQENNRKTQKIKSTKVDFVTMVRGEDN